MIVYYLKMAGKTISAYTDSETAKSVAYLVESESVVGWAKMFFEYVIQFQRRLAHMTKYQLSDKSN